MLQVFVGEPVVGEVQVDPGRFDRAVTGLGLDCLQRHPGFAQPSEAGVAQLVAGGVLESGSITGGHDDLIEPFQRQRAAGVRALQHHEHPIRRHLLGSLGVEVVGDRVEEADRDRHQALMAALAVRDEHPPLGDLQIIEAQPEDLGAA